jgi:cob(I)alamin adenosyltransferase
MRLTRIYTRKGDDGTTGLGSGERVGKDDPQVDAYGDVDELNSAIGVALASGLSVEVARSLARIQSELFNVGGELCLIGAPQEHRPPECLVRAQHVTVLEQECDRFNQPLGSLENFILPGGSAGAAALHLARAICRRAERRSVQLSRTREVPPDVLRYLNRLSDLLFILARHENHARGIEDVLWDQNA